MQIWNGYDPALQENIPLVTRHFFLIKNVYDH